MKILFKYFILTWEVVKLNILSAMEYRVSFFTQVIGMALNDFLLLTMWHILFLRFPNINGWQVQDTYLLFAIGMTNFALFRIFAGNTEEISHGISRGELDYFMTLPKNVLWQVSTAVTQVSAIGDLIFGVGLFLMLGLGFSKLILFIVLAIITSMILYNFSVIVQSMGFFFGNFEESGDRIFNLFIGLALYPSTVFSGVLKFITFTVIPIFFLAWVPVRLLKSFEWEYLLYIIGFWLLSLFLAIWIFNKGLKRYESGNLINLRI